MPLEKRKLNSNDQRKSELLYNHPEQGMIYCNVKVSKADNIQPLHDDRC